VRAGCAARAGAWASDAELGWIATAFDPDVLTIGLPGGADLQRLTLMLRDPDRLEKLLLDKKQPIQLIVAGKSHPATAARR